MGVSIRFLRFSCRKKAVLPGHSGQQRDGNHLENLGYYHLLAGKDGMGLNFKRVKYGFSVGAQPSDPVQNLLFRAGVLPPPPMVAM